MFTSRPAVRTGAFARLHPTRSPRPPVMAPTNKARAAGVSASSFMDLKAELVKKEEEFTKTKATGKSTALVGGVKRPDKVRKYSKA